MLEGRTPISPCKHISYVLRSLSCVTLISVCYLERIARRLVLIKQD